MIFSDTIKQLRLSKNMNQEEFANALNSFAEKSNGLYSSNFNKTNISKWENGKAEPRMDTIRLIASTFNISPNELMGLEVPKPYYELNAKDERDIETKMRDIMMDLENNALFSKEDQSELSEETRELLRASIENSIRLAKQMAKKKFTPKKYRD